MVHLSEEQRTVLLGGRGQLLELFEALAFKGSIGGNGWRCSGADGGEIYVYIASDDDTKVILAFAPSEAVSQVIYRPWGTHRLYSSISSSVGIPLLETISGSQLASDSAMGDLRNLFFATRPEG